MLRGGPYGNEDSRRGISTSRRVRQLGEALPSRLGKPDVGSQRSKPSPLTQGFVPFAKGIDSGEYRNGQLDCDAIAWVATSRGISSDLAARNCREGTNPDAWQGIRWSVARRHEPRGLQWPWREVDGMVVERLAILSKTLAELRFS